MGERWANVKLDTSEAAEYFCDVFYADVYDRAWAMTKDAERAEKLTGQVLAEMCERFRERCLPADPLRYMRSCLTRLQEEMDAVRTDSEVALPVSAESVVPAAAEVPPAPAEEMPFAPAASVNPLRESTVFDAEKTSLWIPGESFDHADLEQARQASRARPKETGNQRSVKLSIFNSALFILGLCAGAYLLYEVCIMLDLI